MNKIQITGQIDREPYSRDIERQGQGTMVLVSASLNYTIKRGDREVKQWVDVEAVGDKAYEILDIPRKVDVTITGELHRAAWQDKDSGEWRSKHYIKYLDASYPEPEQTNNDIPF